METATLVAVFISGLLISFTGYALIYRFWATFSTTTGSLLGVHMTKLFLVYYGGTHD